MFLSQNFQIFQVKKVISQWHIETHYPYSSLCQAKTFTRTSKNFELSQKYVEINVWNVFFRYFNQFSSNFEIFPNLLNISSSWTIQSQQFLCNFIGSCAFSTFFIFILINIFFPILCLFVNKTIFITFSFKTTLIRFSVFLRHFVENFQIVGD